MAINKTQSLYQTFRYRSSLDLVPVGVSARHVHLSIQDLHRLFGDGYQLNIQKELSQPGQFAAKETVSLVGPKGLMNKVRVLGPVRGISQVEISLTDARSLGVNPPIRDSGDLAGSSPITIVGPQGSIHLQEGLIIASRHIHMTEEDAIKFKVHDGARVQVISHSERPLIFTDVNIRISPAYRLEFHIDTDEANAAKLTSNDHVLIIERCD